MKRTRLLLLGVLALPLLCMAEEPLPADLAKKLDPLLAALRSEELDSRQKAEAELSAADPRAISMLHSLLRRTDNIEFRERLARVVSTLAWRSTRSLPKQPVSFHAVSTPLNQLLIEFGPSAETLLRLYPMLEFDSTPIRLSVKDMPADSAMRWVLRAVSPVSARTAVLITEQYSAAGTGYSNEELEALIRRTFFKSNPKTSTRDNAEDGFELVQTFDEHEMVRSFIELLRKPCAPGETVLSEEAQWRKKVLNDFRTAPKVSVDFFKKPFDEAIADFQRSFGTTLLAGERDEDDDPPVVTLKLDRVSFLTALDWTARQNNLDCTYFDHAVHVGKHHYRVAPELECRVYDVRDLENAIGDAFHYHDVGLKITDFIPYAFDPDSGTLLDVRGGRLVVRAYFADQQLIEAHLNGLRQFLAQVRNVEPDGKPPLKPLDAKNVPGHSTGHATEETWEADIRKKLEKTVTFRFVEKPLRDAVAFIREETGANLVFEAKLEKEGLLDSPITLRITEMKAEAALTWILRFVDLQYEMKSEAALICKPHSNCGSHIMQNYYVRDLLSFIPEKDFRPILEGLIRPESWSTGITSIETRDGVLTILQHDTVQEIIEPFLDEIRLHANDAIFEFKRSAEPRLNGGMLYLQETLKKKIKVDLIDKPFYEALCLLGKEAGVTIGFDDSLRDAALPPVTLQARSIELQSALESILKPRAMEFALSDYKIVTGTRQYLNSHVFEATVYNLSDLSDAQIAALKVEIDGKVEKEPVEWNFPLNLLAGKRLILKQPLAVQAEVSRLLNAARKEKR